MGTHFSDWDNEGFVSAVRKRLVESEKKFDSKDCRELREMIKQSCDWIEKEGKNPYATEIVRSCQAELQWLYEAEKNA